MLGGAALNLLGIVDRPTIDVDVLARADATGALRPPDPLPRALRRVIVAVGRGQWVREQDPTSQFHEVVGKVVAYVQDALR